MCSSRDGVPETHLSGREVEFHRADDGVGLLVLGHSQVECRLMLVLLSHPVNVVNFPERHNGISEEKPAESPRWLGEKRREIEKSLGSWSRHQVNEKEWQRGALSQKVIWALASQEFHVILSSSVFIIAGSMHVFIWVSFSSKIIHFQKLIRIVFDTLANFLWSFHIKY